LTIGCVPRSPHSTTRRFETIAALSFFVEFDDALLGETRQRHLDHPDRTIDDAGPGSDDGARLLALEASPGRSRAHRTGA